MELKFDFSPVHLRSAQLLAEDAKRIEEALANDDVEKFERDNIPARMVHDGYAANSIISSAAFLEAVVNEFYDTVINAAESWKEREKVADPVQEILYSIFLGLRDVEPRKFQNKPVLQKYQLLLVYTGRQTFSKGTPPFQSVKTVQSIRNDLVHFAPDWADLDHDNEVELPGNIPGKLEINPFYENYRTPESYLSYDIANWCLESAAEFVLQFYERMEFENAVKLNSIQDVLE